MRKSMYSNNILVILKSNKSFGYQLRKVRTLAVDERLKKHEKIVYQTKHGKRDKKENLENPELYPNAEYYFENGLRKVYPYHHISTVPCKKWWLKKNILDVMMSSFRNFSREHYVKQLMNLRLTVNDANVGVDYVMQQNDLLKFMYHRHEMPVGNFPIVFLHLSDDLVVVDKPPSIPVLPSGHFHKNSLTYILETEFGLKPLFAAHQLDRLTSGVLMLARTSEKVSQIQGEFMAGAIAKEYLCRVEGEFPIEKVTCKAPIARLSAEAGIFHVDECGKASETEFHRLSFDGKSSLVLCRPRTGRTHQIRVHLQYLGHPIMNDHVYNNPAFGPLKGKNGISGKTKSELLNDLMTALSERTTSVLRSESSCKTCLDHLQWRLPNSYFKQQLLPNNFKGNYFENISEVNVKKIRREPEGKKPDKIDVDPECPECHQEEPIIHNVEMYLHAWSYTGQNWTFRSNLPYWVEDKQKTATPFLPSTQDSK